MRTKARLILKCASATSVCVYVEAVSSGFAVPTRTVSEKRLVQKMIHWISLGPQHILKMMLYSPGSCSWLSSLAPLASYCYQHFLAGTRLEMSEMAQILTSSLSHLDRSRKLRWHVPLWLWYYYLYPVYGNTSAQWVLQQWLTLPTLVM